MKRIPKKTSENHDDFWLGLLGYRSAPVDDGRLPGELLKSRRLRTPLPDVSKQPRTRMFKRKQCDPRGKTLAAVKKGETVRVKGAVWTYRARVHGQVAPRSYWVWTEDNRLLRWNRQHLLKTLKPFQRGGPDSDDSVCEETPEAGPSISPMDPFSPPAPRQSTRQTRQPQRLQFDRSSNQVNQISSRGCL